MKRDEVPQDRALFGDFKEVAYAVDEGGDYVLEKSSGWATKTVANAQYWQLVQDQVRAAVAGVRSGETSTLAYFMVLNQMDVGLLASYVGLWKWRVRRHLKKKHFEKLDRELLARYAAVFRITAEELQTLPEDAENPEAVRRWAELSE